LNGASDYSPLQVSVKAKFDDGSETDRIPYLSTIIPVPFATPQLVRHIYHVPQEANGGKAANNSVAVVEFDQQDYSPADLEDFLKMHDLPKPDVPVRLVGPNNASTCFEDGGEACGESTLDIQWVVAVAPQVPAVFWSVDQGFLLSWLMELSNTSSIPQVFSVSYGEPEGEVGMKTVQRVEVEFMKLAARGVTVISTSGDLGASDGQSCGPRLTADYPSSSKFTTSLGATMLARDSYGGQTVDTKACSVPGGAGFTTGGMFSDIFPRPRWQEDSVQEYLSRADQGGILPKDDSFNRTGRAYNDVGALGSNIPIILGGELHITGGTSASGPIFAALVALLNDELLSRGRPSLGFINPWLYRVARNHPFAFRGVIRGENSCTEPGYLFNQSSLPNGQSTCCDGFKATFNTGQWNPLGGLGAPLFDRLVGVLLNGPPPHRQH